MPAPADRYHGPAGVIRALFQSASSFFGVQQSGILCRGRGGQDQLTRGGSGYVHTASQCQEQETKDRSVHTLHQTNRPARKSRVRGSAPVPKKTSVSACSTTAPSSSRSADR